MLIFTSNRIQFFLKTFSNEYFIIRDIIDVQNENNYEIIFQKLQKKKTTLNRKTTTFVEIAKINETIMYVKRSHRRRHFSNFDVNMSNVFRNKNETRRKTRSQRRFRECFICESSKHEIRKCSYLDRFKKYVEKRKIKNQRIKKKKKKKKKQHAFVVENENLNIWISNFDFNDLNEEKLVAFSKKMINNISKKIWIVDIDVSFSMIDDFEFFKEFLKLIKKRVIKIEEKRLYSNKCDLIRVQNKKRKTRLITIFYVSNLKVNFFFD